jgi:phosphate transport system substrate-binding protein
VKRINAFSIVTFILTLLISFSISSAQTLNISGCSVSFLGYLKRLSEEYEKRTGAKVFVRAGGSVMGLDDLSSARVDIAASCKKPDEYSKNFQHVQVAWDALVVIVHKSNPVNNISLKEIREIYAGSLKNFKQLGGNDSEIKVFISNPKKGLSGVGKSTIDLMLEGKNFKSGPNMFFSASTAIVEQMVENTIEGFAVTGYSSAKKRGVKMLSVNGVYPTKENIINGLYPFKRPLYLVLPKNPKGEAKRFVDFALSEEGQSIISTEGVIPLKEIKRKK